MIHRSIAVSLLVLASASMAVRTGAAAESASHRSGAGGSASDGVWLQWRGPNRDGRVGGASWGRTLSGLERQWRVPLGKSFAGPIVAEDRVFVVGSDGDVVRVRALSRRDGKELWRREWRAPGSVPFFAASHGAWVRSTPAYDGSTLYVGDMHEVLHAFDGATGELRWRMDFPELFGTDRPMFGFASSPLVSGDHLYVQAANSLIKLRSDTGQVAWRSAEMGDGATEDGAFSSPILTALHGVEQVVVFTRTALAGVDPESGAVLWAQDVPNFRGMNIVTPVVHDDGIFVSQHRNGSYFYRTSVEPGPDGAPSFRVETAWRNKGSGYMSTPVVIDGLAYLHLGNGRLSCVDLRNGEERWRTRSMGEYWSMVWQDDRILALADDGVLRLIRATPAGFELLDEAEVASSSTWGHLAVAGEQVFVRELEALAAYSLPLTGATTGAP